MEQRSCPARQGIFAETLREHAVTVEAGNLVESEAVGSAACHIFAERKSYAFPAAPQKDEGGYAAALLSELISKTFRMAA